MPPSERKATAYELASDEQLPAWVARVEANAEERAWLLKHLQEVRLRDDQLALWLMNVADYVLAQRGVIAHTGYLRLSEDLGVRSFFAYVPFRTAALLFADAAARCHPGVRLAEAMERFLEGLVVASHHNPLIQANLKASSSAQMFLALQVQALKTWQRFGVVDIEEREEAAGRAVALHFSGNYTALMGPLHRGAARGFMRLFGVEDARVEGEARGPHSFSVKVRW